MIVASEFLITTCEFAICHSPATKEPTNEPSVFFTCTFKVAPLATVSNAAELTVTVASGAVIFCVAPLAIYVVDSVVLSVFFRTAVAAAQLPTCVANITAVAVIVPRNMAVAVIMGVLLFGN